ncbi:formyltransferase domain-containing protein [Campylobacter iguaniorum]|uniref:hypothetical protein n=1 Tax=Campylobacter iguaniorum TaxID=1244531 RepID=UPI0007C9900D|nr:hypothetical protein [Campylobacter iguaniorum]ANE35179.1 formyltransferase domain-containing protein [Campylobacter iguaniorum]
MKYFNPNSLNRGGQLRILFLGYDECKILDFLSNNGYFIAQTQDKIDSKLIVDYKFDFLISYGYRYIIKENILSLFGDNAINLHISYLPWNKGADPNQKNIYLPLLSDGWNTKINDLKKIINLDK